MKRYTIFDYISKDFSGSFVGSFSSFYLLNFWHFPSLCPRESSFYILLFSLFSWLQPWDIYRFSSTAKRIISFCCKQDAVKLSFGELCGAGSRSGLVSIWYIQDDFSVNWCLEAIPQHLTFFICLPSELKHFFFLHKAWDIPQCKVWLLLEQQKT